MALGALVASTVLVSGASGAAAPEPAGHPRQDGAVAHVVKRGLDRVMVGRDGRQRLLRGINVNALLDYPDYFQQTVPVTADDFTEMAALGFDFLRLPLNWSRVEPEPGQYDATYVDQVREIVGWAEAAGMSVLLDMHQDRYNRNLRPEDEADGAPDWATVTDGQPCKKAQLTSPCSVAALDHFWANDAVEGKPLQESYRDALLHLSREFRDDDRLLGFELMNEPTPGSVGSPAFEREQLWPFERRLIKALRADGERRMIWFGPSMLRDILDRDPGRPERFSKDDNLVYAPHIYTGTFTAGGEAQLVGSYLSAVSEARAYGAALVDAEWGGGSDETAERLRWANLDQQDAHLVGSGFWMWKQQPGFYNWHTVEVDGQLRQDSQRVQMLSRPRVVAVRGRLVSTSYTGGALRTVVASTGGKTTLWSGTVVKSGGTSLLDRPLIVARIDGTRVPVERTARRYVSGDTSLLGYRIDVRVPRGKHKVVLRARTP